MKIIYLKSVESTQLYLKQLLNDKKIRSPYAVVSDIQTSGIGSRGNPWQSLDGNLFLSFALPLKQLPDDLKTESISIYFAYLLKETLFEVGSGVWLKWPNDFYIGDFKVGGMITNMVGKDLICGVGLNLLNSPKEFTTMDVKISKIDLIEKYLKKIEKKISWKQVFSKYKLEFYKNRKFFTHIDNLKVSMDGAELQCDGSILCDGERIYSLR